jgi:thiamine-phosphate pyrophosphorylase
LEDEGRAAVMLARAGAVLDRRQPDAGSRPIADVPPANPVLLSPEAERILAHARAVASDRAGERVVASEHLLLALVHQDEPVRNQLLALGLDVQRLEVELTPARGPALQLEQPLELTEPAARAEAARILDAAANRAREAARVVEDYCRFALNDAFLTGRLKQLRHDLATALGELPAGLLEARETQRDVGTDLTTETEQRRHSLRAVVQANLKRLQEALRSLEEYSKLHSPRLGRDLERLRYQSYTLERALLLGSAARHRLADAQLYVIVTGARCAAALDWTIQEAAAGGAQVIQLREKELSDRELLARAHRVRGWTARAGVLFIVNDRPDIARLVGADGVHLGQDDLPVLEARQVLGPDAFIGVSTHNLEQVRQAVLDGASYLGVGPTFSSASKDFTEFPGLDFVRQAAVETSLPAFVLGGIRRETLDAAIQAGARRVAVSHAICAADDPRSAAAALRQTLDAAG